MLAQTGATQGAGAASQGARALGLEQPSTPAPSYVADGHPLTKSTLDSAWLGFGPWLAHSPSPTLNSFNPFSNIFSPTLKVNSFNPFSKIFSNSFD